MTPLNFRTLDLNLLRVFDEVMSERSLTRAAENLAITQPAVSNAMRRLRDAMGDELLVRHGQGVQPTPRAQALWPVVREALASLADNLAPERFDPATAKTTLVLVMADATAGTLIPHLLEILEVEAPGVTVRILPLTTRDPRSLLDEETADLAIGNFPAVLADLTARAQSGALVAYESRRLYDGQYVAAMRRDHPLSRQPLTLERYCAARHALVSFSGRAWGFIDEALASLGKKRHIALTVNQYGTAARVVAQTDLVTVMPRHFVPISHMAEELHIAKLPLDVMAVHVDALWHKRGPNRPAYDWMVQALGRAAQQALALQHPL
ncbi:MULTISPECIES: LysR family transcriptional regulator [Comamonas]|jgi:DNA-binding transcriptional LysR family regulator|uniref:LysR family transcriptional regulator n=1 Tax=Comamonas terrigena TaxID=32013 RepID=A0A2A7UR39_COMTR|nr:MULTISPECIES: LysR family transcriptional regulator [Comamonas]MBD9532919.1 LysR family transcriptional regulator [Comamonas sp. CMM01]MBV7419196.1 LysR family transcriptional regulator [Comamonas sp. CMM03]MDH0050637.1 LysR family transcriptional regulator [Comamonas terrigena]MDH0513027.1 LysR family transcriptional regulator [Comamonas terrigena]MDH1092496.1 LysR family transcriptional regulator [Comamonas terrigena]